MPRQAKVFIHYGPYESCGIVEHREQRLDGLQSLLESDGHSVELVQINTRDAVELWVNGELVFSCGITDLDFGGDGELDVLCVEALGKVQRAF